MATFKFIQASDVHEDDDEDMPKYQHIRDIANNNNVDAVFLPGDLFGHQELAKVEQVNQKGVNRLTHWIPSKDRYAIELYQQVETFGGIDKLKVQAIQPDVGERTKKGLLKLVAQYERHGAEIDNAVKKYRGLINFNKRWTEADLVDLKKELDREAPWRYKRLDKILGEINCPVYAVRGNWELDNFEDYSWNNLKIVEKLPDGINMKGIRIEAAPNWYERVMGIPDSFYEKMEHDMPTQTYEAIMRQLPPEQQQQYMQEMLSNNPVFQRLAGKPIDLLLTHKGPHRLAQESENNYDSGTGLEFIIQSAKPKIILGGHIHGKGIVVNEQVTEDYSYQGVRSSDDVFYEIEMDTDTKQIVPSGIKPYKWADNVSYRKAA